MGQPKKDNTKRDKDVLRAMCTIIAEGGIPSTQGVAVESGYTKPSTYVSFRSLYNQGLLLRAQFGASVVYMPKQVIEAMRESASKLLKEANDK